YSSIKVKGRPRIVEKQSYGKDNTGNGYWRRGKKAKSTPAGHCLTRGDVGNDQRERGPDGRGRSAENHGILERDRSRRKLEQHELNVMQREIVNRQHRRRYRRECRIEQRCIR